MNCFLYLTPRLKYFHLWCTCTDFCKNLTNKASFFLRFFNRMSTYWVFFWKELPIGTIIFFQFFGNNPFFTFHPSFVKARSLGE